jgi:hypothetical protein
LMPWEEIEMISFCELVYLIGTPDRIIKVYDRLGHH